MSGVAKPFAWSYSALKNFETCPKRYYHYNVLKDVDEPRSAQLDEGDALHSAFERRIKDGANLPLGYGHFEPLLARVTAPGAEVYGEKKLALNSSFAPVSFFARDTWFRTVIDATRVAFPVATVFDWKTGKPQEDITQLQLMAATLFAYEPRLERINAALVFVNHGTTVPAFFAREDTTEIWGEVLPRVRAVERARAQQEYPPTPSGLCRRYCAVTSCPFHGKGG